MLQRDNRSSPWACDRERLCRSPASYLFRDHIDGHVMAALPVSRDLERLLFLGVITWTYILALGG